jgi:hypothetical protein
VLFFLPLAALAAAASEEAVVERRVKAAYLYRFAGYVEWPASAWPTPNSALVIGVWGNDELADDLTRLVANRTVDNRRIEVRRVTDFDSAAGTHMLFADHDRMARLPDLLASTNVRNTLVVTESAGALKLGSAINFLIVDGQVRFELSLEAAEQRGLKLSSRLVVVSTNLSRGR